MSSSPKHIAIWGFPTAVTTWKTPQSPTVRLRSRVKAAVDSPEIYALAVAPNAHSAAMAVVGLKRTLVVGTLPDENPTLTPEEQAMLEKLQKAFAVKGIGWAPLDLSKDKVGFARVYLRNEFP